MNPLSWDIVDEIGEPTSSIVTSNTLQLAVSQRC